MSMMGGLPRGAMGAVGDTVATFTDYEQAQKAVSRLIAADIPARDIAIVGMGLRSVERVTGRLGYATAARSGAINGVLLGLLFSAILVIGAPTVPIQAFVGVLFVGIAIGMLLSIVSYSFVRRRRDYASVMQVLADHYDLTVAAGSIHRARQVMSEAPGRQTAPPAAPVTPDPVPVDDTPEAPPAPPADPAEPAPPRESEAPRTSTPPRYGERIAPPVADGPGSEKDA
jgi:hypothetical protein